MALPPYRHKYCTDEAQKAEIVLSAVSFIYIHIGNVCETLQVT